MYNGLDPEKIWVWDACYMALFARYAPDIFPGVQTLDNFYGWQRQDGFIAMTHTLPEGKEAYGERINPPLFAWAEWEYYRTTGRTERIRRVLPHLVRHLDWIAKNRRQGQGLFWFEDAGSSGMDNSPRGRRNVEAGRHMGWVDLSSQVALLALHISRLAEVVGWRGIAQRARAQWENTSRLVNDLCWCPRSGFYHDYLDKCNWLASKTAAGFWPMLAQVASADQVDSLCRHLENPATFGRPCPVPSLSYDDPNYTDRGDYWLGGVWAPINYMVLCGLRNNGRHDLARQLAGAYLDYMASAYARYEPRRKTLWEAYAPETPQPSRKRRGSPIVVQPDFVGWTGLGPTAIFYESILGLDIDVPLNTLTWRVGMREEHGVENLPFGDARISLRAAARKTPSSPLKIEAISGADVKLVIINNGRKKVILLRRDKARTVNFQGGSG